MAITIQMRGDKAAAAYTAAFKRLKELPGFQLNAVLRAEAGSILKAWAGRVKVAKREQVDWRSRYRAGKHAFGDVGSVESNPYGISVNTGLRGGVQGLVWWRSPAKKWYDIGIVRDDGSTGTLKYRHYPADAWARIQDGMAVYGAHLKAQLELGPKTIGFSRQAVIQIADDLGIDLTKVQGGGVSSAGVAKARAAIASNGRRYKNGHGTQGGNGNTSGFVRLMTEMPKGSKRGIDRALIGVLSGRAGFIQRAYKKGAFNSMRTVAKSFPNVFKTLDLSA